MGRGAERRGCRARALGAAAEHTEPAMASAHAFSIAGYRSVQGGRGSRAKQAVEDSNM